MTAGGGGRAKLTAFVWWHNAPVLREAVSSESSHRLEQPAEATCSSSGSTEGKDRAGDDSRPVTPETITSLLAGGPAVLPSLLLCDFGHLHAEVEQLQADGARGLHLDVMDGRFVPQLTYGPVVVEAVCRAARVPVDAHLMIEDPLATLGAYIAAGVDMVTLHVEALADPRRALQVLRDAGVIGQLAISPGTPVAALEPLLTGSDRELCDGVLVMSVEPGFGGQAFLPQSLEKLAALSAFREHRSRPLRLGVDGGISATTVGPAAAAGAELIVAGSAVLRSDNYARALQELERNAREAASGCSSKPVASVSPGVISNDG